MLQGVGLNTLHLTGRGSAIAGVEIRTGEAELLHGDASEESIKKVSLNRIMGQVTVVVRDRNLIIKKRVEGLTVLWVGGAGTGGGKTCGKPWGETAKTDLD